MLFHLLSWNQLRIFGQRINKSPYNKPNNKILEKIAKLPLSWFNYYPSDWFFQKFNVIDTPTNPEVVNDLLMGYENIDFVLFGVQWGQDVSLKEIYDGHELISYDRLLHQVRKSQGQNA